MSIDTPNEYETAIEDYAAAVRHEREMRRALIAAQDQHEQACNARQALWRTVAAFVNNGTIKPGIYRLHKCPGLYADGLLIEKHHDYPELFEMFR